MLTIGTVTALLVSGINFAEEHSEIYTHLRPASAVVETTNDQIQVQEMLHIERQRDRFEKQQENEIRLCHRDRRKAEHHAETHGPPIDRCICLLADRKAAIFCPVAGECSEELREACEHQYPTGTKCACVLGHT